MNKKIFIFLLLGISLISLASSALTDGIVSYWDMEESSGKVLDQVNTYDGVPYGLSKIPGIIGEAYYFDTLSDTRVCYINIGTGTTLEQTGSTTTNAWVYLNNSNSKGHIWSTWATNFLFDVGYSSQTNPGVRAFLNGGGQINTEAMNTGTWNMVTFVVHGTTNVSVYINGVLNATAGGSSRSLSGGNLTIGSNFITANPADTFGTGIIDEMGIWNRSLSSDEILSLYNSGAGLTYPFDSSSSSLQITLNSPANSLKSDTATINFNVTVTDDLKVQNVSLKIDEVINETNSSNVNGTYIFTKTFSDGSYNWSILAFDNESQSTQSATRTFLIDTVNPIISITAPGTQDYLYSGKNLTLTFTATDTNLETCIWEYNGANTTIPCTSGVSKNYYFDYVLGKNNGTLYVNDSVGRKASSLKSWTYNVLENSVNYSATTYETATETFTLNITLGSGVSLNSAYLNYNGSREGVSIISSGTSRLLNSSIQIPLTNVTYNATLFWELTTSAGDINTTSNTQTVNTLKIDDCSVNTHVILNYTIYDEDTRAYLSTGNNITANLYVKLSGDLSGTIYNFYSGTKTTNPIAICVDNALLSGEQYRLDALVQYTADDYVKEYNYIENAIINTTTAPDLVPLYLLAVNNSQEFLITYKDSNLLPVQGAIIELTRQYPELGPDTFLSVENMKTDADGKTIGHFVLSEEIYTIYVKVNGEITATYENQRAFCTNLAIGDCTINLNEKSSTNNPASYQNYLGVISSQSYDKTARELSFDFTTVDSSTKTINLSMYKVNGTITTATICSESLTSSAGTLTCTVPAQYYNDTALVRILVDGEYYNEYYLNIASGPDQEVNAEKYILAFFLIITLPMIAFTSGPMTLVMFLIGFIAAGGLYLIDLGGFIGPFSAFLWIVIAAIILLAKAAQRRQQF